VETRPRDIILLSLESRKGEHLGKKFVTWGDKNRDVKETEGKKEAEAGGNADEERGEAMSGEGSTSGYREPVMRVRRGSQI